MSVAGIVFPSCSFKHSDISPYIWKIGYRRVGEPEDPNASDLNIPRSLTGSSAPVRTRFSMDRVAVNEPRSWLVQRSATHGSNRSAIPPSAGLITREFDRDSCVRRRVMKRLLNAIRLSHTLENPVPPGSLRIFGMHARDQPFGVQPRSTQSRLIVDSRSSAAIFDTKADAPASKNAWLTVGSFMAVKTITFVVGFTRVISRHASSE